MDSGSGKERMSIPVVHNSWKTLAIPVDHLKKRKKKISVDEGE